MSVPIPVVCALIFDATGRVLIAQRPPHKHLAHQWEFPGGKVEPGEAAATAIRREIREELGCSLGALEPLSRFDWAYPETITMIPFRTVLAPGSPSPFAHEHTAMAWVPLSRVADYDLAPADRPIVATLISSNP